MHTALHSLFNAISMEHYEKYISTLRQYNKLTNNNEQWDILSHANEQNKRYFNLIREKTKYGIISVVFLVMSIEGLINEYGFVYLGQQRFEELEKQGIKDKILHFFFEVTGKKFPKDRTLYQNISDLIAVRNTLVHSKSIEIDISDLMRTDDEGDKKFISYINSMVGNSKEKSTKQKGLEEVLEKSYKSYEELKDYLQKHS